MQNFKILDTEYDMPEPEPKWSYAVGTFVVAVQDFSEALNINVRRTV